MLVNIVLDMFLFVYIFYVYCKLLKKKLIYFYFNGFLKDFVKFNEKLKVVIVVIVVSNE